MDFQLLKRILKLMEEQGLSEFEWEEEGKRVRLKKGGMAPPVPSAPLPPVISVPPPPSGVKEIVSPMVGTFYRAPAMNAPPFVEAGQRVKRDDVVCVIEAMKVMNEITADAEGEVVAVLVQDGQPVEFGQPLFRVKII